MRRTVFAALLVALTAGFALATRNDHHCADSDCERDTSTAIDDTECRVPND